MAGNIEEYNLDVMNSELAKEWHPTKNGTLRPKDVTPGSVKKIWWMCNRGHEWEATVNHRTYGSGCPYCSGNRADETNCLQTVNPQLAEQWHPTKNGTLTPKDVTAGSNKKVWWICSKGHEWEAIINNRSKGSGCPYCARKRRFNGRKT